MNVKRKKVLKLKKGNVIILVIFILAIVINKKLTDDFIEDCSKENNINVCLKNE